MLKAIKGRKKGIKKQRVTYKAFIKGLAYSVPVNQHREESLTDHYPQRNP